MKKPPVPAHSTLLEKDRLVSLIDAVLAIIMTILVLNLEQPNALSWEGFWALRESFFAFTFSFFWLAGLWLALNRAFSLVSQLSHSVFIAGILLLYVCSFVPYLTILASKHFHSLAVQLLFRLDTALADLIILYILSQLEICQASETAVAVMQDQKHNLYQVLVLKLAGLIISFAIWPPAMMISIVLGTLWTAFRKLKDGFPENDTEDDPSPNVIDY